MHMTLWHVDKREDAAILSSQGIALGANWTFYEKLMPFVRAGWSDGDAPLMNKTATVGLIHRLHKSDLIRFGFNWGDPSNSTLRDQYTTEVFLPVQIFSEPCIHAIRAFAYRPGSESQ